MPSLCAAETAASVEVIPRHPLLSDDLVFMLGVFYPRSTTAAALTPSAGGTGAIVNFEDALALDKRSVAANVGMFWRASENWNVNLEYFEVTRDATRTLAQTVEWGDTIYTVGTTVNSGFDFSDLRVSAAYSFFRRQDKELSVGLGLHVAGIKSSLSASGVGAESADVTAPLPVLNVYSMFALTNEWALDVRADWLSLNYDNYSGDVRNVAINALYQPWDNIGFGLGVRNLVIDIAMDDADWRGQARLVFQGPTVFMTVSF